MLQFGDAVSEVIVWCRRLGANEKLTKPLVRRLMNEAMKELYPIAIASDPDFFATRLSFGSTTLLAYPDHYRATLLMECTDSDCTAGFAIPTGRRDRAFVYASTNINPTNADPTFLLTGAGIEVQPARQGYHYFLKTFADITDDTTDLETCLPWLWIEPLILKTTELARLHTAAMGDAPSGIEKGLRMVDLAHESLKSSFKALKLFNYPVPEPAFPNA